MASVRGFPSVRCKLTSKLASVSPNVRSAEGRLSSADGKNLEWSGFSDLSPLRITLSLHSVEALQSAPKNLKLRIVLANGGGEATMEFDTDADRQLLMTCYRTYTEHKNAKAREAADRLALVTSFLKHDSMTMYETQKLDLVDTGIMTMPEFIEAHRAEFISYLAAKKMLEVKGLANSMLDDIGDSHVALTDQVKTQLFKKEAKTKEAYEKFVLTRHMMTEEEFFNKLVRAKQDRKKNKNMSNGTAMDISDLDPDSFFRVYMNGTLDPTGGALSEALTQGMRHDRSKLGTVDAGFDLLAAVEENARARRDVNSSVAGYGSADTLRPYSVEAAPPKRSGAASSTSGSQQWERFFKEVNRDGKLVVADSTGGDEVDVAPTLPAAGTADGTRAGTALQVGWSVLDDLPDLYEQPPPKALYAQLHVDAKAMREVLEAPSMLDDTMPPSRSMPGSMRESDEARDALLASAPLPGAGVMREVAATVTVSGGAEASVTGVKRTRPGASPVAQQQLGGIPLTPPSHSLLRRHNLSSVTAVLTQKIMDGVHKMHLENSGMDRSFQVAVPEVWRRYLLRKLKMHKEMLSHFWRLATSSVVGSANKDRVAALVGHVKKERDELEAQLQVLTSSPPGAVVLPTSVEQRDAQFPFAASRDSMSDAGKMMVIQRVNQLRSMLQRALEHDLQPHEQKSDANNWRVAGADAAAGAIASSHAASPSDV